MNEKLALTAILTSIILVGIVINLEVVENDGDGFEPVEKIELDEGDFLELELNWNGSFPTPRNGYMNWKVIEENSRRIKAKITIGGDLLELMKIKGEIEENAGENVYTEEESYSIENLWSGGKDPDLWNVESVKEKGELLGNEKLRTSLGDIDTHHYRYVKGDNSTDVYLEAKTGFPVRIKYQEENSISFTITETNIEFFLDQFQPICC